MTFRARLCRCALPGAIVATLLHASAAQPQDSPTQRVLTGTVPERHRVLIQLLKRPSAARPVAEWDALAAELHRIHEQVQSLAGLAGNELPAIGLTSEDATELRNYYSDLTAAVAQSNDPAVLPLLLECVDAQPSARYAVARFGDAAVDGLLATARGARDYDHACGALGTLAEMYESGQAPLSTRSQEAIVAYVHEAWIPSPLEMPVIYLADLSLATRDAELRAIVTQLADDPSAVASRIAGTTLQPGFVIDELNALLGRTRRPPVSTIAALRSGDDFQMEEVLRRLLNTPRGDRTRAVLSAAHNAYVRRHRRPPPSDPRDGDSEDEVAQLLVRVLSDAGDAVVIPALVATLGNTGWPTWEALARFGDQSIAPLIRVARGRGDDSLRGGALSALAWMLEPRFPVPTGDDRAAPPSSAGRRQIVSFAREAWRRPRLKADAVGLTTLALATGDSQLRESVAALAADPAKLRAAGLDGFALQMTQRFIEQSLATHPER